MSETEERDALLRRLADLLNAGEGRQAFELGSLEATRYEAAGDLPLAIRLHLQASQGARSAGDRLPAEEALARAEALVGRAPQRYADDLALLVSTVRARARWAAGELVEGLARLESAWNLHQAGAQENTRQSARLILGALSGNLCQIDDATRWFQAVLDVARASGDSEFEGLALGNLASCQIEKADSTFRALGLAAAQPWLAQAEQSLRTVWSRVEVSGSRPLRLMCLINLAHALRAQGQLDEAQSLLESARALYPKPLHQDNLWTLWSYQWARLHAAQGRDEEAAASLELLMREAAETGEDPIRSDRHALAAELAERRGDAVAALAHYKEHVKAERLRLTEETEVLTRLGTLRAHLQQAQTEADQLRREVLRDPLTGLANRRALDEAVNRRAARRRTDPGTLALPMCVAMIDIDHFKQVNDRHSHAVGDEVLRLLAARLAAHCRASDLAVRLGGEEFVVLLDGVELDEAAAACERLRAAVQAQDWSAVSSGLTVTVSIGVAPHGDRAPDALLPPGPDLESTPPGAAVASDMALALAAADRALYVAKRSGRNRVVTSLQADQGPVPPFRACAGSAAEPSTGMAH